MEEELEIILRAVDEASDTFASVGQSANDMGDTLEQAFQEATAEVERLKSELEFAEEWGFVNDVEELESQLAEAEAEAERLGEALGNVESEPIEGVAESSGQAGDSMDSMTAAADAFTATALLDFAQQVSDTLWNLADSAGTVRDSMDRASLEAEGFGLSAESMKGVLGDVADETGRAGGQIRESFIKATARGVTDMDAFKSMMEGAGAQAYLFNTSIDAMANKFSNLAMRDTLMTKTLSETGITMDELATAMGMTGATADEVKEKWKSLDTNQRAALLGTAASMNEAEDANEHYKNSWQGLQDQIDKAKAKLEVMIGNVLLPVLIPALQVAARVLDWFGGVLGAVMDGPLGGIISILGAAAAAFALLVPTVAAVSAAFAFYEAAISPAIAATWALISPLLPFIAIGAAIVLIIYEIGKAFGWWTDASSMIDAIGAGLQRLWSAFINHPDVQAAIAMISNALSVLWSWIVQAGQAILEFFGISTSGEFDVVRAIIDSVGATFNTLKTIIMAVVGVFMAAGEAGNATADAFGAFWNDTLAPFGEWLSGVFAPVWQLIGDLINAISPFVANLTNAFTLFANGQMDLPNLIWTVLTTLFNAYVTIFSMIISRVMSWGQSILSKGVSSASNFVNGIIHRIMTLPGRVYSQLMTVVGRIQSAIQAWISAAVAKVSNLVSQVVNGFSGLPGKISSALSGVVSAITQPFQNAYDNLCGIVDNIVSKASEAMSAISGAQGGEKHIPAQGGEKNISTMGGNITGTGSSSVDYNLNINLSLDAPRHINTEQLGEILSDRGFIRELVNNRDFQLMDSQAKAKMNLKNGRARGV